MAIQIFMKNFKGCKPSPQYLDTINTKYSYLDTSVYKYKVDFFLSPLSTPIQIVKTIAFIAIHVSEKYKTKAENNH